jgi:hypothetical protein
MSGRFARSLVLVLVLCLLVPVVRAETLPLPDNLTDLNSNQGETFFLESDALATYFPIADNFVTQKTQAYCGVAVWSWCSTQLASRHRRARNISRTTSLPRTMSSTSAPRQCCHATSSPGRA